jgi:hypothetical protein
VGIWAWNCQWAIIIIILKTSDDMAGGENEASCSVPDVIRKLQNTRTALGCHYSLQGIKILFSYLQRAGRGRDKTGKSINKMGMNQFPSPKKHIKIFN